MQTVIPYDIGKMVLLNSILRMHASNIILQSVKLKGPDTFQTRLLVSQKVIKRKRGGYTDYYCRGLFYSNVSFWFHFYCFVDSVIFFTSSEISLHWFHRL